MLVHKTKKCTKCFRFSAHEKCTKFVERWCTNRKCTKFETNSTEALFCAGKRPSADTRFPPASTLYINNQSCLIFFYSILFCFDSKVLSTSLDVSVTIPRVMQLCCATSY